MYRLIAQDGTQYPFEGPAMTFGREECDIILPHDERVSRQHARVELKGDRLLLTDLNSTNGTFVNGERILTPHILQPGDQIRIGDTVLTVHAEGKAPPTRVISEADIGASPQVRQPSYSPRPPSPPPAPPVAHRPGPGYSSQPSVAKDKSLTLILEFLVLGLGWIYAGEVGTGIAIMATWLILGVGVGLTIDLLTGGFGCVCTVPLRLAAYALSLSMLGNHMKQRPNIFQ